MKTGFKDQTLDVGDIYVTREWLISNYPDLANGLITLPGQRLYGGGTGYALGDGVSLAAAVLSTSDVSFVPWRRVGMMSDSFYGIKADGSLWTWGYNAGGQLGDGTTIDKSSPVRIGSDRWLSSTGQHAIRWNGTLWGWGSGVSVGDGTQVSKSSPVQIGTSSWSAVSGTYGVLAIRQDDTLWAWGYNNLGQLGNGATINRSSPVQIGTAKWIAISGGSNSSLAIRQDGTLWAWGYNGYGQLGDGTTINKSSPVQIGTSTNWRRVAAAGDTCAAITNDNSLYVWGRNQYGQLGDGTTINKSSPVQLGSDIWSTINSISDSTSYSRAAVTIDGSLWVWGRNNYGQLGDGTTVDKSSPVRIGTTKKWISAQVGFSSIVALTDGGAIA